MDPPTSGAVPQQGELFAGKYLIGRLLGEGGVGVVLEAHHQRLNKRVAIKLLRAEACALPEWRARFEREARAAVRLRGPNVARVYDVDSAPDGTPFIVMELLEGHDLAEELSLRGPLPVEETVGYLIEACSAMAEAHALGIIHRDLTSANIFLARGPERGRKTAKVVDFGISKITDEASSVTTTDAAFGTPHYASPEQVRSTRDVDARTDVWSLGVILFEALTGVLPFDGKTASAVVAAVVMDPPRQISSLRADLPPGLVNVMLTALMKSRDERFQSVTELAQALAPYGPQGLAPAAPLSNPGRMTGPISSPGMLLSPPPPPAQEAAPVSKPMSMPMGFAPPPSASTSLAPPPPASTPALPSASPGSRRFAVIAASALAALLVVGALLIALSRDRGPSPAASASPPAKPADPPAAPSASAVPPAEPAPLVAATSSATSAAPINPPASPPSKATTGSPSKPKATTGAPAKPPRRGDVNPLTL